jgi:hypothetical protein
MVTGSNDRFPARCAGMPIGLTYRLSGGALRAVGEACVSVNARLPLQRFYDIAVAESLRQTIIEYHSKDDEGE